VHGTWRFRYVDRFGGKPLGNIFLEFGRKEFSAYPIHTCRFINGRRFGLTAGLLVTKVRISAFIATLALGKSLPA
jgi:ribose/xylose/arabinose/galactoside ABC-type transport system permease subunit